MHLAAPPAWFADNVTQIAILTLLALTILVVRFVQVLSVRIALLVLLAISGVVVYLNRAPLQTCALTCECQLLGQDVTVPVCRSDTEL